MGEIIGLVIACVALVITCLALMVNSDLDTDTSSTLFIVVFTCAGLIIVLTRSITIDILTNEIETGERYIEPDGYRIDKYSDTTFLYKIGELKEDNE